MRWFRRQAAVQLLCLLLVGWLSMPAFTAAQGSLTPQGLDEPWPVLPDGRVVFTIYDVRLAVPTCPICLRFSFWSPGSEGFLPLKAALADPRRLRELIAKSKYMTLTMHNSWYPDLGPFLGKYDRFSIPHTSRLDLTVYREPIVCGFECQFLRSLAAESEKFSPDGFRVLPGPVQYPGTGATVMTGVGSTLLVASLANAQDVIGAPIRFYIGPYFLKADNSSHNGPPAFAVRKNVDIFFDFDSKRYVRSELTSLHARVMEAVSSVLLEDEGLEKRN